MGTRSSSFEPMIILITHPTLAGLQSVIDFIYGFFHTLVYEPKSQTPIDSAANTSLPLINVSSLLYSSPEAEIAIAGGTYTNTRGGSGGYGGGNIRQVRM
jgi:hypothetical protein